MEFPEATIKLQRVLTYGSGPTAVETACQLTSLGYEVLLVNPEERWAEMVPLLPGDEGLANQLQKNQSQLLENPLVSSYRQTSILKIEGFAGEFKVRLHSLDRGWVEEVGVIVLASELASEGNFTAYHLSRLPKVLTLEDPVDKKMVLEGLPEDAHLAFLVGLAGEGNVSDMARVLTLALEIRQRYSFQVFIFCRHVKVAEEGLERLYQACRDEGVIFFKFDQGGPEIEKTADSLTLQFTDALIGQSFELSPDLLIIDSRHSLPSPVSGLALAHHLGLDKTGFLQPANVHLLPYGSERAGIFIAGASKGPLLPSGYLEEAQGTVLAVHSFLKGSPSETDQREVTVDKGLCTLCLTCLRFCPHQAIGWTHRVFIHPLACRRCGICASECPMDAIQITGYSDPEVENRLAEIGARWENQSSDNTKIILFGCQRSAGVAWDEARSLKFIADSQVEFISLPCAGKIDPDHLLKALAIGAEGVLILACPEENCRSLHGNTYARERMAEASRYLEEAGLEPNRIRFRNLSSNMVWYLQEGIKQFQNDLEKYGTDKLKKTGSEL